MTDEQQAFGIEQESKKIIQLTYEFDLIKKAFSKKGFEPMLVYSVIYFIYSVEESEDLSFAKDWKCFNGFINFIEKQDRTVVFNLKRFNHEHGINVSSLSLRRENGPRDLKITDSDKDVIVSNYKNGNKEGVTYYYLNDRLRKISFWKNGKPCGIWKQYFKNHDKIQYESEYNNEKLVKIIEYTEFGHIFRTTQYNENGEKHSDEETFLPTGELHLIYKWVEGCGRKIWEKRFI